MNGPDGRPLARPLAWSSPAHSGTSAATSTSSGDGQSRPAAPPDLRVGHRALERLRKQLSARDLALLAAVDEHRFLTSRHVERLLFFDHASPLAGARSARRALRRLHELSLLRHLDRRVGGLRAGSASYIWHLSAAGNRLLHRDEARRWHEPSERLLSHYLAVAETAIGLREAARGGQFELVRLDLEPAGWRRFLGAGGEPRLVRPDLYAVTAAGEFEDHWFVEIDLGSEHPPTVIRQCQAYLDYQGSGQEQADSGVFPRIVWRVPDQARAERLRAALTAARLDPGLFKITTTEGFIARIAGGAL